MPFHYNFHCKKQPVSDLPDRCFELLRFGWEGHRRIHGTLFHLDIINGKVWIQYDGTDRPIAEELVRAGIPKEDIVLAEQPADIRPFTGYGVG